MIAPICPRDGFPCAHGCQFPCVKRIKPAKKSDG
jgi:hypothetical protein